MMIKKKCNLYNAGEYKNPLKGDFIPNIMSYLHEDDELRPAILIVPGGGYCMVAPGEANLVAKEFYNRGYNAFVLTYTTAMFEPVTLGLQPLKDIARAMAKIRGKAEKYKIDPNKIIVCGFSAGGHLTSLLATHYDDVRIIDSLEQKDINIRPNAVILSYPVISTGEFCHRDSIRVLLGENPTEDDLEYMSTEKNINENTPPTFLWTTVTDELVPMENTLLFAEGCKAHNVPFELHVFSDGPHGYSVATERWASGDYGDDYTMEQWFACMQYYIDNEIPMPAPFDSIELPKGTDYRDFYRNSPKDYLLSKPNKAVSIWPELVDNWLKRLFEQDNSK